jgi:hypothetical protein
VTDDMGTTVTKRSPAYWRVTFDMPPLNIFGPDALPQLDEIVTALETDEQVRVVVFDSAVDGFLQHPLRLHGQPGGHDADSAGSHGPAEAPGPAGPGEPRSGRLDRVHPRPRDGRQQ